jgi:cytochrome c biogenesis protein CcmG, thiol:disulfide interchange protein DsbE
MRLLRSRVRMVMVAAGVAVALVVAMLVSALGRTATFDPVAVLGTPAPADTLPLIDGGTVRLDGLRGKAVIVNFWNSWCGPCRQEAPSLERFYAQHAGDRHFAMVGIVIDDSTSAARRYVEDRDIPWQIALDPGSHAALDFGTTGQPETYAISPDGVIVAKRSGPASVTDLTRMLAMARGQA